MKAKYIFESEKLKDIVITLPNDIEWEGYKKELDKVKDYKSAINFKVPNFPKKSAKGQKCFLNYRGNIIGWMEIIGFIEQEFNCSTTGKRWKGKFIQRSGPFHYIDSIPMKGFRGFRYME